MTLDTVINAEYNGVVVCTALCIWEVLGVTQLDISSEIFLPFMQMMG